MIACIQDKTGNQFLKRSITLETVDFEKRNLARHLENAKVNPKLYRYLDIDSSEIKVIL